VKVVRIATVVWGMVLLAATPAGAAPVVATDEKFWFYWVAPLLVLGFLAFLGALALGYYVRVIRPQHRGRPVEK
jgi:hypothetical protein